MAHFFRGRIPQVVLGLALFAGLDSLAQTVVPPARRTPVLTTAGRLAEPLADDSATLVAGAVNPFSLRSEPGASTPGPVRRSRLAEMGPEEILRLAAEQVQPTGKIILGNRKVLLLPAGRQVREGQTLRVTVLGEEVELTVEEINPRAYRLGFQGQSLDRPLR